MIKQFEGKLKKNNAKIAIITARFNSFIVERLLEGAIDAFIRHDFEEEQLEVFKTPGAFELPVLAKKIAESGKYDAILALGAVIRGATPHFDYVSAEVSKGLANVSIQYTLPVGFGVLTTDNVDQAVERAGTKSGNKGFDAALSVIEMIDLFKQIK
jgi:6,7-dimethyl-8-ribityllumazine synthase